MPSVPYDPEVDLNKEIPGSPGGPIEAVKRGMVQAFRAALTGASFTTANSQVHVDMEYPLEKVHYPGVWVQFSLSELAPAGHGHQQRDLETGNLMQTMTYSGRVTLTLVALSSKERDRLSDQIINILSFSRVASPNVLTENGFAESYSTLYEEFDKNPYISITINSDKPRPMGQSVSVGTPWHSDTLVYEDAYAFDVIGQFMLVTENEGLYRLRRIDIDKKIAPREPEGDDGKGQWL